MTALSAPEIAARIRAAAADLGFADVGFAPAAPPPRAAQFRQWLDSGYAGTMTYLARSAARRADPRQVLPGAQTIICVAQNYCPGPLPPDLRNDPARGIIAAYAAGSDYHDVLLAKLEQLARRVAEWAPAAQHRCYVDTGPLLERDHAQRAGLGFIGKNTLLIHPRRGSFHFLGEIVTTLALPLSEISSSPSCGSCTRCLIVCPTHAFPAEYVLDSRRCISYLTIEYKGVIPRELRGKIGNHVFGCDDCQDCCPWNERFAAVTNEIAYRAADDWRAPLLAELAALTEVDFARRYAASPLLRPGYAGMLRNVAVALGNWGAAEALDPLQRLAIHDSPLVRLHAAWGLGRLKITAAAVELQRLAADEPDPDVRAEARAALEK